MFMQTHTTHQHQLAQIMHVQPCRLQPGEISGHASSVQLAVRVLHICDEHKQAKPKQHFCSKSKYWGELDFEVT